LKLFPAACISATIARDLRTDPAAGGGVVAAVGGGFRLCRAEATREG
jgi:hypothetical protein